MAGEDATFQEQWDGHVQEERTSITKGCAFICCLRCCNFGLKLKSHCNKPSLSIQCFVRNRGGTPKPPIGLGNRNYSLRPRSHCD